MLDVVTKYYIFSPDHKDKSLVDNAEIKQEMIHDLYLLGFDATPGFFICQNGTSSVLVVPAGVNFEKTVRELVQKYSNEYYMVVHYDNALELVSVNGEKKKLGKLVETETLRLANNTFYLNNKSFKIVTDC